MARNFDLKFLISAQDNASRVFDQIGKRGRAASQKLSDVGGTLTKGLTLPIVGAGIAAAKTFNDFNVGLSKIATLDENLDAEGMKAMGEQIREIGNRVPKDLGDLSTTLYDIRSAGVDAANQFKVLEGSAKLATAGLGTTQEAADLVTSAFNAFNLQGEDAEKVYDNIFKTVKNGKTTISGLSQGFGAVAGTIAAANIPLDEYLSSVAALTTTGEPAAQAHTQLRAVVAGLTRETKESKAVFKELGGKNLPELITKYGGLVPVLKKISEEYGGDQAKLLQLVGSTEALNAVIGLTTTLGDKQVETLRDMREGADSLEPAFKKMADAQRWTILQNKFQGVAITIGEKVLPIIEKLMKHVEKALDWFNKLSDSDQELVLWAAAAAAALGPLLMLLGSIGTAISGITAGLAAIGGGAAAAAGTAAATTAATATGTAAATGITMGVGGMAALGLGGAAMWGYSLDRTAKMHQQEAASQKQFNALSAEQKALTAGTIDQGFINNLDTTFGEKTPAVIPLGGLDLNALYSKGGQAPAAPQEPVKTEVVVDFRNLPQAATVRTESTASTTNVKVGKALQ